MLAAHQLLHQRCNFYSFRTVARVVISDRVQRHQRLRGIVRFLHDPNAACAFDVRQSLGAILGVATEDDADNARTEDSGSRGEQSIA